MDFKLSREWEIVLLTTLVMLALYQLSELLDPKPVE